LLYKKV